MKQQIITVNLYEAIDDYTGTLVDQCVALTESSAVAYGEHHVSVMGSKGWYEVKVETLH